MQDSIDSPQIRTSSEMLHESGNNHCRRLIHPSCKCYPKGCAATRESAGLVQHMKAPEQAQKKTSPRNINVTSKSSVGDISVVTLIRTDTTLDHRQKGREGMLRTSWRMSTYHVKAATGAAILKIARVSLRMFFCTSGYTKSAQLWLAEARKPTT